MELHPAYFRQVAARAEELEQAMSVPGAASNPRTFKDLVREHQRLRDLTLAAAELERLRRLLADNAALLADSGGDPELAEIARAEKAELEAAIPKAEHRLIDRKSVV